MFDSDDTLLEAADVATHQHFERPQPGSYGFTQTIPTHLINSEVGTPPGDVPVAYAVPMIIPPGESCRGVSIAMRGTSSTTGWFEAAVYQSQSGSLLPIAVTGLADAMPTADWHTANFPAPIPASDEPRKVMVYVSVWKVNDSFVKLYDPGADVAPFIFNPRCYISTGVPTTPAVLDISSGRWQPSQQYPIIALS